MSNNEQNIKPAPEVTDLSRIKFEVFRLEQEEKQLQFIAAAHRKQGDKMEEKGKHGIAHLHHEHARKLFEEVKQTRADLAEMKNQLDDATGE